jgi:tetratricopeptide (TPR) repeat protein
VLTDLRAAAHGVALQALHLLSSEAEPAAAADALEKALRLAPRSATLHAAKGMLLLESGGLQPAYDAFRAAAALREDPARFLCLALVRLAQQDLKAATTLLDQALGLEPSFAVARAMRAMVLASQAKLDDASAELDRADQIEPGLPETLQTRALILLSQDKADQGIALLRQAIAREPEDDQIRFQLWRVLAQLGREAEAQAAADAWLKDLSVKRRELLGQQLAGFRKALKERGQGGTGPGTPGAPGGDPFKLQDPTMGPDKSGAFPAQPGDPSDKEPMLSL